MPKVKLTVTAGQCRCGICRAGDTFLVEDVCPPLCHEFWNCMYPFVYTLLNGGELDYGERRAPMFDMRCPDGGRVVMHGECVNEE